MGRKWGDKGREEWFGVRSDEADDVVVVETRSAKLRVSTEQGGTGQVRALKRGAEKTI